MTRRIAAVVTLALLWSPVAGAQEPLAWKLRKGDEFTLSVETKSQDKIKGAGKEVEIKSRLALTFDVTVRAAGGDNLRLGLNITKAEAEGGPAKQGDAAKLGEALKGGAFTVTVDRKMKVVRLGELDKLVEKVAEADPTMPAAQVERVLKMMFRYLLEESFVALPAAATAKGDSWKQATELDALGMGTMLTSKTYTDEGPASVQGKPVRKVGLKAALKISLSKEGGPLLPPGVSIDKFDLKKQQYQGTLYFDPKAGRPVRLDTRMLFDFEMTLSANDMNVDLSGSREQTFTIRFGSKKKAGE
jgi:hypothetical protein